VIPKGKDNKNVKGMKLKKNIEGKNKKRLKWTIDMILWWWKEWSWIKSMIPLILMQCTHPAISSFLHVFTSYHRSLEINYSKTSNFS